jgi:hypothetical protein
LIPYGAEGERSDFLAKSQTGEAVAVPIGGE